VSVPSLAHPTSLTDWHADFVGAINTPLTLAISTHATDWAHLAISWHIGTRNSPIRHQHVGCVQGHNFGLKSGGTNPERE